MQPVEDTFNNTIGGAYYALNKSKKITKPIHKGPRTNLYYGPKYVPDNYLKFLEKKSLGIDTDF